MQQRSIELREEIERSTGEPLRLTSEELHRLAKKAKGIDLDQLKRASALHPDDFTRLLKMIDSLQDE